MSDQDHNNELDSLKTELEREKEAKLMALADLDNFRKRVEIERQELMITANLSILNALADMIDDFERMVNDLEVKGKEDKIDAFKPVLDKAKGIMVDYGVEEIVVNKGDNFDHAAMQAIGTVKTEEEKENNKVLEIAQKGYRIKNSGRVVRHARVIVSKK